MKEEDKIFGLIVQAEDIQKHAIQLQSTVQEAIKTLPVVSREAIRDSTREFITEGVKNASKGILEASSEGRATAKLLKRTGLFQGIFLVMVAFVVIGCAYGIGNYVISSRINELAGLKSAIQQERNTLAELQSKTWGLELAQYQDGTKGIILPKEATFSHSGQVADGRIGIVFKP